MKIKFCSLKTYSNREELYKDFGFSKQRIKKYLNAKQRQYCVREKDELEADINLMNHLRISPEYTGNECIVLEENENFLILHKAQKIHSHPLSYNESNNVLSFLRKNHYKVLNVNNHKYDRGLLYRLDFETSGLLIICKDNYLYEDLRSHYNKVAKVKEYLALVNGHVTDQSIYDYLDTSKKVVTIKDEGQEGNIDIKNLKFFEDLNISLIKVRLHEGLRHQIRVLLQTIKFPILGDIDYRGQEASRLFLHCYKIGIDGYGTYESKELSCFSEKLNLSIEELIKLTDSYSFS